MMPERNSFAPPPRGSINYHKDAAMQRLIQNDLLQGTLTTSILVKYLIGVCLLVFVHSICVSAQTGCALKIDKDSLKIYLCHVEESKFKAVKTTFFVNSSLSEAAAMILDIEGYVEWQYKTISANVVKKVSDREIIYYTEVGAPIITSNRDFVIRLTLNQDALTKALNVEATSLPDYLPSKEKIVRVPFSTARWTITPVSARRLFVEYYIEIDIGGAVPPWLVNVVAPGAPYETFKAMREKVGRYKGKTVPFIKN